MRATLRTAGERVELDCAIGWLAQVLAEGAAGQLAPLDDTPPDVRITVEEGRGAFDPAGFRLLTRGTWCRPGQVIMRDACASGLDLLVTAADPTLDIVARWRPRHRTGGVGSAPRTGHAAAPGGTAPVSGVVAGSAAWPCPAARLGVHDRLR